MTSVPARALRWQRRRGGHDKGRRRSLLHGDRLGRGHGLVRGRGVEAGALEGGDEVVRLLAAPVPLAAVVLDHARDEAAVRAELGRVGGVPPRVAGELDAREEAERLRIVLRLRSGYCMSGRSGGRAERLTLKDHDTTRVPSTHPTTTKLPRFSAWRGAS